MTGRLVVYDREMWIEGVDENTLEVGAELEVIRGNGPREGERMGTAIVTAVDENGERILKVVP